MTRQAVVIGGGTNELVAAHVLRRAGYAVAVFAEHATTAEDSGWVPRGVARHLRLKAYGLEVQAADPWAVAPLPQGGRLELRRDVARTVEAIRRVSPHDAAQWPGFCASMARLAGFLEKLYVAPPPDPLSARFAVRARLLGARGLVDLLRLLPMSVAELLDDWFEHDVLKGLLAAGALKHLQQGPRSGGTAFGLLHSHVGNRPGVFRPPRSNVGRALAGLPGLDIRRQRVRAIHVSEGRATGIVLEDGSEIAAPLVVSGLDAQRTLLALVDPGWLDPELVRAVRHIRARGILARLKVELDRPPGFPILTFAPSLDYLERAYDETKYGRASTQPWLDARWDGHALEVDVQYVPYDANSDALGDVVAAMLSESLGDAAITAVSVQAPRALEAELGWPGGQAHHAELSLDQALWARPIPELAHYRTPIEGLWLCGPGTHPGAGVAGASGYNCARAVLAVRKR